MSSNDAISVRIARINQQLMSTYTANGSAVNSRLNVESLQDALLALYDECDSKSLRHLPGVDTFLKKFHGTVSELKKKRVRPSDFELQSVIGRGNFGEVSLVKERATGHFYAMKSLPKHCSSGQREASSYEEERDILALAAQPGAPEWLTALHYAFQDTNNLYLVMEYLPGGDLLGLIDRFEGGLPEDCVRFYLAETVQAVHSLHKLGYVHRDVKPENLMLDRCGHIKLVDFGSAAKLGGDGKVKSPLPVGTPEYIAPEVLQSVTDSNKVSYGVECDYWSLGIVAFELLFGATPFQAAERTQIYSNIMSHETGEKLEFPSDSKVSRDMKSLITGLLEPAETRFDYIQIKKHRFFTSVSWDTLRDIPPPYVPVVLGETDTTNFTVPTDTSGFPKLDSSSFVAKQSGFSGHQLAFVGFTLTPGVAATKPACSDKDNDEEVKFLREVPSKPSEHPDIIRSRELTALRDKLKDREERLEQAIAERRQVETKLDHMTIKASNYRQVIEQERQERREVETKAVEVVKSLKTKWQLSSQEQVAELTIQLEMNETSLRKEKARVAELEGKLRTREEQLDTERQNSDRLQALLQKRKDNISKARRETLTCLGDAQQMTDLRIKLGREETEKKYLQEKVDLLTNQVSELQAELSDVSQKLEQSCDAVEKADIMIAPIQEQLKNAEAKLKREKLKHQSTKDRLTSVESEFSSSVLTLEQLREAATKDKTNLESLRDKLTESEAKRHVLSAQLEDAQQENEELQAKVTVLEQMLSHVEERIVKLEEENVKLQAAEVVAATMPRASLLARSEEVKVLQAQLERLEEQLEKAREALVLEKQEARTARSDLYKKEKELSDIRIDLRIASRELKTAEESSVTLSKDCSALKSSLAEAETKEKELTSQLEAASKELETTKSALREVETQVQMLRNRDEDSQSRSVEQNKLLGAAEAKAAEKSELASKLQASLDRLKQELETSRNQLSTNSSQLAQLKSQMESLQLNNNALRETCTILDEQLEESEKLRESYDAQLLQAKEESVSLRDQLGKALGDLRAKTAEADEMKALRSAAEERLASARKDATFQASEALEETRDLRQQLNEARQQSEQLLAQVNELEQALCESDRSTREQHHMVEALQAKCTDLQEEISATLTDLQRAREASDSLSVRLEATKQSEKKALGKLSEAQKQAAEEKAASEQNILKLQATIVQHTKLIDFLQSKAVVKKKKTLADVLFGARPKENVAPSPSPLRPTGQLLTPMSAQAIHSAKLKSKTWTATGNNRSTTQVISSEKQVQQTPVSSKVASVINKPEPSKESKKESQPVVPAPSPLSPLILGQRVLPEYCRISINCAVTFSEQVVVLGAEEGLYSLHRRDSGGFQLVQISGITRVKQLVIARNLGIALFIAGKSPELSQCELRELTVAAEAAQCSKPSITLKLIEEAPDACHMCAVSGAISLQEQRTANFLCVANSSHVAVMRWDLSTCQFVPVRLLATTHPTASMLFTPHSLLLVCNDVFELDLQDFSMEDFLDQSDTSLSSAKAALKIGAPQGSVALIDVTKNNPKAEPEFLLCLPDFAVFLDGFGHRSRPSDIKWSHRPQAFLYAAPALFVQFVSGVLVLQPSDGKLCATDESFGSTSSVTSSDQNLAVLNLDTPKLLGVGVGKGSVVVSALQTTGTAIITLGAPGLDADLALDSDVSSSREEFSFTSSLENSMEADGDAGHKKVQFV